MNQNLTKKKCAHSWKCLVKLAKFQLDSLIASQQLFKVQTCAHACPPPLKSGKFSILPVRLDIFRLFEFSPHFPSPSLSPSLPPSPSSSLPPPPLPSLPLLIRSKTRNENTARGASQKFPSATLAMRCWDWGRVEVDCILYAQVPSHLAPYLHAAVKGSHLIVVDFFTCVILCADGISQRIRSGNMFSYKAVSASWPNGAPLLEVLICGLTIPVKTLEVPV